MPLTAIAFTFGLAIPIVAAVLYIAIDAIARACRSDGTKLILEGLAWAAKRFAFGAATVTAWETAAADRRREARRRRLLSK